MSWPRLRGLLFFLAILIMASLYSLLSVFTSFTSREPDELEHSDSQLEEPAVAHDVEAKARRRIATTQALIDREAGAILPPEIFLILLRTIMTWDRRLQVDLEMIRTHPLDPDLRDQAVRDVAPARTLKTCALVCRYWAIRCREVMFRDRIIELHSYRQARRFKSCLKVPNSMLEPITTYISGINVEHVYSRTIPFFELVNLPQTRGKLAGLFICGPFPDHIPPSSRDTPHWNAPFPMACRITPSNTAYKDVTIRNLDFPSFKHVAKYMRHFGDAEAVRLQKITWPTTSDFPREFVECLRRPNRRSRAFVSATRCTDDLLVCLHVSMMFARFPLRREVPKDDQLWAIELFTTIRDFYYQNVPLHEDSKPTCHLDSFEQANWAFNKPPLHFWMSGFSIAYPQISVYFECAPRLPLPGRRSFGPIRIVGMTLVIHAAFRPTADTIDKTFDLTAFRSDLDCRYALSFTVIAFGDYDTMLAITQRHPTLLTTPDPRRRYVLACKRSRKHPFGELKGHPDSMPRGWVGIDPVTLTSNGMEWDQEKLILPDLVKSQ